MEKMSKQVQLRSNGKMYTVGEEVFQCRIPWRGRGAGNRRPYYSRHKSRGFRAALYNMRGCLLFLYYNSISYEHPISRYKSP